MRKKKGTRTVYRMVVRSELSDRYAVAFAGLHLETKDGRSSQGKLWTSPTSTASSTA
jgi:hypothetical protein